ncbi:MAG: hypothetical protein J0H22_01045 [Actinobacteria bacterium]|nr:hypothetical protein [Actinomycetota bacterium]
MPIVAEQYTFVIGVDTHAATHSLSLVNTSTGAVVDQSVFPNTPPGLDRALTWIINRIDGQSALVVIEGVGSYGAGLADRVTAGGLLVAEPLHTQIGCGTDLGQIRLIDQIDAQTANTNLHRKHPPNSTR